MSAFTLHSMMSQASAICGVKGKFQQPVCPSESIVRRLKYHDYRVSDHNYIVIFHSCSSFHLWPHFILSCFKNTCDSWKFLTIKIGNSFGHSVTEIKFSQSVIPCTTVIDSSSSECVCCTNPLESSF